MLQINIVHLVGVVREVLEEMFISETKIMSRIFGPSEKR
jgi:hypothetical protein